MKTFIEEINQRKSCSQKLKYVTTFDYIDKILIFLSATTGRVSLISLTSITTGVVKKLLNITREKKTKRMIKFLC